MTDLTTPSPRAREPELPSAYNLALIALLAVSAGLALAYLLEALSQTPRSAPVSEFAPPLIEKNIAGTQLSVPQEWLRNQQAATGGFADQVDLLLTVELSAGKPETLGLLLTPHSRAQSSAYLLDKVYLHQFTSEQMSGYPGLIGKPLRLEEGFEGETIWYDPLSPMPFVAKCQAAPVPEQPATCMRTVRLTAGLSATYSFSENLLSQWPAFDEQMRPILEQIGAVEKR